MSVTIVDLEVYNYVAQGLQRVAKDSLNAKVDSPFYSISALEYYVEKMPKANPSHLKFMTDEDFAFLLQTESRLLVKSWLDMNERCYNAAYNDEPLEIPLSVGLEFSPLAKEINPMQLAKYLYAIAYNIEEEYTHPSQEELVELTLLRNVLRDVQMSIVTTSEEWRSIKPYTFEPNDTGFANLGYIYSGLIKLGYHTTIDQFYCYPATNHFRNVDPIKESARLIGSWISSAENSSLTSDGVLARLSPMYWEQTPYEFLHRLVDFRAFLGQVVLTTDIALLDSFIAVLFVSQVVHTRQYEALPYSSID